MLTLGLEEEFFIATPLTPRLASLWYLGRLFWSDPHRFRRHTDSNFARRVDWRCGAAMGSVEVSTGVHGSPGGVVAELQELRRRVAAAAPDALLLPLGRLPWLPAPSLVAGLHVHIGAPDPAVAYARVVRCLPALLALTATSADPAGERRCLSRRLLESFATGPLRPDPTYRFQDVIVSRRLGTVEVRAFDACWDLGRIAALLEAVACAVEGRIPTAGEGPLRDGEREVYNRRRRRLLAGDPDPEVDAIAAEISEAVPIAPRLFRPPAEELAPLLAEGGPAAVASAVDAAYRGGALRAGPLPRPRGLAWKGAAGLMAYYLPRLPYKLVKYRRDWHGGGVSGA